MPHEKHYTMCGTPNYISPEIATRSPHGLESDVWSLGCMFYTLLIGKPPFDTDTVKNTLNKFALFFPSAEYQRMFSYFKIRTIAYFSSSISLHAKKLQLCYGFVCLGGFFLQTGSGEMQMSTLPCRKSKWSKRFFLTVHKCLT
uniref:Serine/threonine-protein kinase SAK n=1 Tax=Strix occidentalis caurina TaxID=311401 RepID=A0A8D0FNP8_STROC